MIAAVVRPPAAARQVFWKVSKTPFLAGSRPRRHSPSRTSALALARSRVRAGRSSPGAPVKPRAASRASPERSRARISRLGGDENLLPPGTMEDLGPDFDPGELSSKREWVKIGNGSFGNVYKASLLGVTVAVKEIGKCVARASPPRVRPASARARRRPTPAPFVRFPFPLRVR